MECEIIIELNKIPPDLLEYFEPIEIDKGTTWRITTKPFSEAHYAVFPEALVEPMVKSGCPEFVCTKCGKAREKIMVDTCERRSVENYAGQATKEYDSAKAQNPSDTKRRILESQSKVYKEEYTNCDCNAEFIGGTVIDPFAGSGTAGEVALKLGRNFIGIELNPKYCELAQERISGFERNDWKAKRNHVKIDELVK